MEIDVTWDILKSHADSKSLLVQYIDLGEKYMVIAIDKQLTLTCSIHKIRQPDATTEFENNYKDTSNKKLDIGNSPFASKVLVNGKKLYAREHGLTPTLIASSSTTTIEFMIPYASAKITGASILGCQLGDTANFKVLDTDSGALTTIPKYELNRFGHDVNMHDGEYKKHYSYDADLFYGLYVAVEYTNNGTSDITVAINLDLHEVK